MTQSRLTELAAKPNRPEAIAPVRFEKLGGRVVLGLFCAMALLGGIGGWALTAKLTGAVIAMGTVTVDENLKVIQHRDGGIVRHIAVREGDLVTIGQVLVELDDAQSLAELSILDSQLFESQTRRARLLADRDGLEEIVFPQHLMSDDPAQIEIIDGEVRLHAGNIANRDSQRRQFELGIDQIGEEIAGLQAQREALSDEAVLVEEGHARLASLAEKGLIQTDRLEASDRERVQLRGRKGELDATIARSAARISEIRIRILAIEEIARTEAQRELGLIETRVSELTDRVAAVEDRLSRTEIRSPTTGIVNELHVHTVGGVISPAEVLATIVPADAILRVEVRVPLSAIDQVYLGQPARVRFSAFNHRTTPELMAEVAQIAPASTVDPATGEPFYVSYVTLSTEEMARLGDLELVPGMPAEIYLSTEEQTAMSYFARPIIDQFERAFREE